MFENLFAPLKIGDMELRNRIVMAPIATGFAKGVEPTDQLMAFLAERAKGGAGLLIVEGACVDDPVGKARLQTMAIDDDKYIAGLGEVARAIHAGGAKACLQLGHAGRYARSKITGVQPVAPSAIASRYTGEMPRELTTAEVEATIEKFGEAGRRAREAGFDAVEILGSTGYLLSQFVSAVTNHRSDRFGGDTWARATFIVEVIQALRKRVGKDFPISYKLSVDEFMTGGNTIEDSKIIARRAAEAGASIIHSWAGWNESPVAMLPMSVPRGAFVYLAEAMKEVVDLPTVAVGRINDPKLADEIIGEGRADLVATGRAFLADPDWPNKAAEGRLEDIRMCIGCCRCFDSAITSMAEADPSMTVVCAVNAELGREVEERVKPAEQSKRVLVIGGGPAGMEAARVASIRGHRVTLWEKQGRLGGNLLLASVAPYKEECGTLSRYFNHQMETLGVQLELNREVTPEAVLREKPDVVVIATGSSPASPQVPGTDRENVVTALDALSGKAETGQTVVVVGGGFIGCEVAEFLADKGKNVTIVEMLSKVGHGIGPTTRWVSISRLRELGVDMLTQAKLEGVTDSGVTISKDGHSQSIEADTVVMAVGLEPDRQLFESLHGEVPNLWAIGDCVKVDRILEAIHDGWRVGCEI